MALPHKPDAVVLGGGLWGVVLAQQLAQKRARVRLWEYAPALAASLERTRRHPLIPGFRLDDSIRVSSDLAESCAGASLLVFVLPSRAMKATAQRIPPGRYIAVNASKGIEPKTLATMGEIIEREMPSLRGRVWTLSGPSFAREVARGVPTSLLLAGPRNPALAALFTGGALQVRHCPDRVGVELGGSLKNVIAVGAGILDGLGAGANSKAALLVQGLEEMGLLIRARGGRADTIYGLAGLGDLIATGTSPESRNRAFGEKLGKGLSPRAALDSIPTVVEGIEAADSARTLARRCRVKTPLLESIFAAAGGAPARGVLEAMGFHG